MSDATVPGGQPKPTDSSFGAADSAEPEESDTPEETPARVSMPTSQPVLLKALRWGAIATLVLLLICGGVGWLIDGSPGLIGGVIGAAIAGLFLGLTVGSIAFGNRFINHPNYLAIFFAIVVGGWVLKFVAFIVAALLLRDQPWLNPQILFFSLIAGVLVSLVIDAFVMLSSRIPILPEMPRK